MNILFTIYHGPDSGGSEVSSYLLAKALKKRHNVIFASTMKYPGFKTYIFKEYGRIPDFTEQNNYIKNFIREVIKKEKIDIVHSHDRLTIPGAILADKDKAVSHYRDYWFECPNSSCLFRKKEIFNPSYFDIVKNVKMHRVFWDLYKLRYLRKNRRLLNQASKKIAISNFVKERLEANGILDSKVVPNPIDLSSFNIKVKRRFKGTILTYVGDFSYVKGIKNILEIMKEIVNDDVRFVMVGKGNLFGYAQEFIIRNNLQGKIILLGKLPYSEVVKVYKESDIIVFPSVWQEPFGRISIEAMAASKPVIGSNVGGIRDTIIDGETGFLVNSKEDWIEKINLLVKDKKLRNKLGKQGRKEVEKYSSDKVAKQVEKIYNFS